MQRTQTTLTKNPNFLSGHRRGPQPCFLLRRLFTSKTIFAFTHSPPPLRSRNFFTSEGYLPPKKRIGWRCSQESWVIFYFHHLNLRTLILWETEQLNLRCCRPTSLWPFLLLYSVQVHTALFWPPKIFRVSHQLAREEDILCDSSITLCCTGLTPTYFWNIFFKSDKPRRSQTRDFSMGNSGLKSVKRVLLWPATS